MSQPAPTDALVCMMLRGLLAELSNLCTKPKFAVNEEVSRNMETRVGANESIESALKRFKKMCQKSGVLAEARRHEHYEKPSVRRKKKSAAARKRRS